MEAILPVLRTLIDAVFGSGAITDLVQRDLHAKVDAADPAVQAAAAAPPPLTADEQAELARLQAKQDAAAIPGPVEPVFGAESHPYA